MRIVLFTRSLEVGGAERQLAELAKGLNARGHHVLVIAMYPGGQLERELTDAGVRRVHLGKRSRWHVMRPYFRLVGLLRREKPAVLYSFLVTPSLLAAMAKPLASGTRVVWGVRGSKNRSELRHYGWFEWFTFWMTRLIAHSADLIIANSVSGRRSHVREGYPPGKVAVVANGVDTGRYFPDAAARGAVRCEWGLDDDQLVVGTVGRVTREKGIPELLAAASIIGRCRPEVRFAIVGCGDPATVAELKSFSVEAGVQDRVLWVGPRTDMPAVYNGFDILCSASLSEGFSNVLLEGMAVGIACVATDVGDASRLVRGTGELVPPGDPNALSEGIMRLLDRREGDDVAKATRSVVLDRFTVDQMVENTLALLASLSPPAIERVAQGREVPPEDTLRL